MKTPSGINDLENEPAYKRRKINLDEVTHSSENPISRFTLSNDENGKPKLNDDNSFLHDNVENVNTWKQDLDILLHQQKTTK